MSIKALQDYTYYAKYARWNKETKKRETWNEAWDRVIDMHISKFPVIESELRWASELGKKKIVLGSQRILQFGGDGVLKHNARAYNCSALHIDRTEAFQQIMYLLLCGTGVGFSVQKHHIDKLPDVKKPTGKLTEYIIDDSIEGWSDSIGVLISSYMGGPHTEYDGKKIDFNYSKIRKKGSKLSTSSGKAPGPEPLMKAHIKIREILNKTNRLKTIEVYDIIMHIADSVLSGGVRRSATSCIFSPDDEDMIGAKTGNWFYENPQRARSNNSAILLRDSTDKSTFESFVKYIKQYGEPGFVFADDLEQVFNPCFEISLYPITTYGKSGVQFCNLCEINGKKIKTKEDWKEAVRAAVILGTVQAAYTDFPYLGKATEDITREEALLGVSMTGIMDSPDILLDPNLQKEMAKYAIEVNKEIAQKIGINPAARVTTVKPAGTTSCILGTSSGIHPHHAKRYIRRVQANKMEDVAQHFVKYNPMAVEYSVWSANDTDWVISFCIEVPDGSKTKNQMPALQLLENIKNTQQNWIKYGTNLERCRKNYLIHNVSNTITVKDNEWEDVIDYIYKNRKYFAAVSMLADTGDKDYPQAPFTTIYTPQQIVKEYGDGSLFCAGLIQRASSLWSNLWFACDALLGLKNPENPEQEEWIKSAQKFGNKYFEGNLKKLSYCMKDIYNWKTWVDLNNEYKDVDYSLLIEEEDNTNPLLESACAGGKCEII